MRNTTIEKDTHKQIERLPIDQKRKVLEYVRELAAARIHGVHGQNLLRFAGTIDHEDLIIIEQTMQKDAKR